VTMNEKYEALKTAVGDYAVADPPTKALRKAVTDAQKAYITAQANVNKKQTEINLLGLELVSINKRLEEIETALAVESRTVWCVDYSTALTGSVGTIEINGEADAINIMPGGATGAGLLQHPLAMTPSGVFVNSAKLPAWQKWMPTYRAGVITSISGNTCNVALDAALSSAQSIDINQAIVLANVPIEYMTMNGGVFAINDHVIVKFTSQSWSNPKVVGFYDHPKTYQSLLFVLGYMSYDIYSLNNDKITLVNRFSTNQISSIIPTVGDVYTGTDPYRKYINASRLTMSPIYWNNLSPGNSVVPIEIAGYAGAEPVNYRYPVPPSKKMYLKDDGSNVPTQPANPDGDSVVFYERKDKIKVYASLPECKHSYTLADGEVRMLLLKEAKRIVTLREYMWEEAGYFYTDVFWGRSWGPYEMPLQVSHGYVGSRNSWMMSEIEKQYGNEADPGLLFEGETIVARTIQYMELYVVSSDDYDLLYTPEQAGGAHNASMITGAIFAVQVSMPSTKQKTYIRLYNLSGTMLDEVEVPVAWFTELRATDSVWVTPPIPAPDTPEEWA
jgi:signal peptidase I